MNFKYYFNYGLNKNFFFFNKIFFIINFFNKRINCFYFYKKSEFFRIFRSFMKIKNNQIYSIRMFFKGVGYKILKPIRNKFKNFFKIDLGFSILIYVNIPYCIKLKHTRDKFIFFSFNKIFLFKFAKLIFNLRIPEVYKGKGVRYLNKNFILKPGKQRLLIKNMSIFIGRIKLKSSKNKIKHSNITSFKNIFNINKSTIKWILAFTGQGLSSKFKSFKKFRKNFQRDFLINNKFSNVTKYFGKDYKQIFFLKFKKLKYSSSIKSFKFQFGLPVHNQRTHSNASTCFKIMKKKIIKKKSKIIKKRLDYSLTVEYLICI